MATAYRTAITKEEEARMARLWAERENAFPSESQADRCMWVSRQAQRSMDAVRKHLTKTGVYKPRKKMRPSVFVPAPKPILVSFAKGKSYRFRYRGNSGEGPDMPKRATCEGKQGRHWIFRAGSGWRISMTDAQVHCEYVWEAI